MSQLSLSFFVEVSSSLRMAGATVFLVLVVVLFFFFFWVLVFFGFPCALTSSVCALYFFLFYLQGIVFYYKSSYFGPLYRYVVRSLQSYLPHLFPPTGGIVAFLLLPTGTFRTPTSSSSRFLAVPSLPQN